MKSGELDVCRRFLPVASLIATMLILGWPGRSDAEEALAHAARLYDVYCAQCHGMKRDGKGVNSPRMSTAPRDHTDPKGMGDIPSAEMFKVIKEGGLAVNKSALMPAWESVMSDEEVSAMVRYLHEVCNCGGSD